MIRKKYLREKNYFIRIYRMKFKNVMEFNFKILDFFDVLTRGLSLCIECQRVYRWTVGRLNNGYLGCKVTIYGNRDHIFD